MGKGRVGERSQSSQSPFFPNKCSAVSNFRPLGTNALLVPLVHTLNASSQANLHVFSADILFEYPPLFGEVSVQIFCYILILLFSCC